MFPISYCLGKLSVNTNHCNKGSFIEIGKDLKSLWGWSIGSSYLSQS